MTKTFKRFLSIIFVFVLLFLGGNISVNAKTTTDATKTSSWTPTNESTEDIYGMTHIKATGNAVTGSTSLNEQINVYKMKTDGITSKLVTWAVQKDNKSYVLSTLTDIAKDYEANHPGWIVLGGINADQYYFMHGLKRAADGSAIYMPQPYYPLIMDSEVRFGGTVYNVTSSNYVGFTNDGSSNPLVNPSTVKGFVVSVIGTHNEVIKEITIDKVNETPTSNEIALWFPSESAANYGSTITKKVTSETNLIMVENADLSYASNSRENYYLGNDQGIDAFFGKGYISNIGKEVSLKAGMFALETNNTNILSELSVGTYIRVNYLYNDEKMNNVEAASGYHTCHIDNGVEQTSNADYNTKRYSRSLFGITSSGEYLLLSADIFSGKVTYKGLNFTESNAVLKHYDAKYAYQGDGGGSVTAIVRNSNGELEVCNQPQYDNQRTNLSGLLFVKRVSGLEENADLATRNSVTLELTKPSDTTYIDNVVVKNGTSEFKMVDNKVVVTGLAEDTTFNLNVTYDVIDAKTNEKVTNCEDTVQATTKAFVKPDLVYKVDKIGKNYVTITKIDSEYASWFKNCKIIVGDQDFYMGDNDTYKVEGLIDDTSYVINYQYDIVEPSTNNTYKCLSIGETIRTLGYELPVITSFTNETTTTIKMKYEYDDEDDVVVKAYILYGENLELEKELTRSRATITFDDLEKGKKTYQFQLILKTFFESGYGTTEEKEVKSEIITIEKDKEPDPVVDPNPDPDPSVDPTPEPEIVPSPKKGCKKSQMELVISIISVCSLIVLIIKKRN